MGVATSDGRKFHTPASETVGSVTRLITLPTSFLPFVGELLSYLSEVGNWFEVGITASEAADIGMGILESWYTNDMIGVVAPFASLTLPAGWLPFDGVARQKADYPELYAVLHPLWRTPTTFTLPNMYQRTIIGGASSVFDPYGVGKTGGEVNHTLTVNEMPAHTHTYTNPIANVDIESPGVPDLIAAGVGPGTNTGTTGGGQAHNNMPPWAAMQWAVFAGR